MGFQFELNGNSNLLKGMESFKVNKIKANISLSKEEKKKKFYSQLQEKDTMWEKDTIF